MKIFICFIFTLLLSVPLLAQHTIKGSVTDKNNTAKLPGVTVFVTELNKGAATDENGNYSIALPGKGDFKILISCLGYQTKFEKINLNATDQTLDIQLEKSVVEVNEVVISGAYTTSQNENPQEIDVIKKTEMQQTGASTLMDVISRVPGVSAITTGPLVSRPVIRGLSGNRILTVADGVRFETQQWDDEHGIGVNELGMDRVEIIKGPASLLYGPEAMGGVIHIVEEQPAPLNHITGDVRASAYSNNAGFLGEANVKGATEKYNWSAGALTKALPDYYYQGYNFRAPNTRLSETGARASFGINRNWGSTSLAYQFNKAYYGILDGKDIVKGPNGKIINKDTAEKDMFPSEVEAPYHSVTDNKISSKTTILAGASRFNVVLGYQNNARTEYEDNGSKEGYEYVGMTLQSTTYDLKWALPAWKNFSTIVGIQGMYQVNTNSATARTQLIPDAVIQDRGFVALTKYNRKGFNVTIGGRTDNRNLTTVAASRDSAFAMPSITRRYSNASGAIGAAYNIAEHLLLRANFASGYRAPNLNELLANGVKLETQHYEIGNSNFIKEKNRELDLSAAFTSAHFSLEVAGFINNINNFIYLTPTGNVVKSNLSGAASVAEYRFLQADARLKGGEAGIDIHPQSWSWIHYEIKAARLTALRLDNNSYLPMMPANKIYNTLTFAADQYKKYSNVFARISVITTFAQNKVAANEPGTAGYTLLNASIGATRNIWKLNAVEIVLAVNNALDKVYIDNMSRLRSFGIANPGRNVVLSLRIPFDIKRS